jgi:hypothetical protein
VWASLLLLGAAAHCADSYDGTTLTIPTLVIGAGAYSNVVVTPQAILTVAGGTSDGGPDNYDPSTNRLSIPTVVYHGKTYDNVTITVGGLVSIGSVTGVDTLVGKQLQIPSVQVPAGQVYGATVMTYGEILSKGGGMPASIRDSYDPATRRLTVNAVEVGGKVYTNAIVTLESLISVPLPGIPVPNVAGESRAQAATTLAAVGLSAGAIATQASATVPAGAVIAETPAPGTLLTGGSAVSLVVSSGTAATGTSVLTYKYDAARSGANLTETVLTPANVQPSTFGLRRNLAVDGRVDAQPLYVPQLSVAGAPHNVVYVATEHDSVYAFDADTGATLWKVSLMLSGETPSDSRSCGQVTPEIGITSTPVIDLAAGPQGVIYVVAMTRDASSRYHQRLHALDLATGTELAASPTEISSVYGATTFQPGNYKERAALLLNNGTIYTSWASHCDIGSYGGWVIAFNQATLAISGVLNLAQGASGGGYANQGPAIWMSGGGPAADAAGNVYLLTANGRFETTLNAGGFPSGGDFGNSFVKLTRTAGTLAVADYFAMSNEASESAGDVDLGSGEILLLPDLADSGGKLRQLAVGAGKDGNIYVVDRNDMGGFSSVGNDIWQQLTGVMGNGVYSTPAYFNGTVFYASQGGTLQAYGVDGAFLSTAPTSQTVTRFAYPGALPVVSANGTANGIVWAYENASPATLHAYDAGNLATEIYNSDQAAGNRDRFGDGNKFIAAVVADGKVFVATIRSVAVFGLLP